jgi:hypothetical protein
MSFVCKCPFNSELGPKTSGGWSALWSRILSYPNKAADTVGDEGNPSGWSLASPPRKNSAATFRAPLFWIFYATKHFYHYCRRSDQLLIQILDSVPDVRGFFV